MPMSWAEARPRGSARAATRCLRTPPWLQRSGRYTSTTEPESAEESTRSDAGLRTKGSNLSIMAAKTVWLFQGNKVSQPSAAFSQLRPALAWIGRHSLSGMLTAYPLNEGAYDWAVRHGYYRPKSEPDPAFIGKFTSASQKHYHFEHGVSEEQEALTDETAESAGRSGHSWPPVDQTALLWVFLGEQSRHPAAVFDDESGAGRW